MRSATIFNAISLIFFILTVVVIVVVGAIIFSPPPAAQLADLPTNVPEDLFPTLTPTFTHTPTFTPTLPPTLTPTFTATPTVTPSVTPSLTPTITNTPSVTFTPSITPTPSDSPTPLPTFTPTGPTPTMPPTLSPYLFGLRNVVRYVPNFANTLGCAWQGIGGQVFDLAGLEVLPGRHQVRVFGGGIEVVTPIGSNSVYGGASGWEVQVASTVNSETYFVRLETVNGTVLSEVIQVPFFGDCARNTALVDFGQLREP